MRKYLSKIVRKVFYFVFQKEVERLNCQLSNAHIQTDNALAALREAKQMLGNIDVSVDVHEYHSPSWAVMSLQGGKTDYIKFIDLSDSDIRDIARFLRRYERHYNIKIDASPMASQWLRIKKNK